MGLAGSPPLDPRSPPLVSMSPQASLQGCGPTGGGEISAATLRSWGALGWADLEEGGQCPSPTWAPEASCCKEHPPQPRGPAPCPPITCRCLDGAEPAGCAPRVGFRGGKGLLLADQIHTGRGGRGGGRPAAGQHPHPPAHNPHAVWVKPFNQPHTISRLERCVFSPCQWHRSLNQV